MSFPNTYDGKVETEITSQFQNKLNLEKISLGFAYFFKEKTGNETKQHNNSIEIKNSNPLFFFSYTAKLKIEVNDNNISVNYSFSLIELFKVLIVLVIFAAFFSNYRADEYLIVIALFSIVFFVINLFLIKSNLQNLITEAIEFSTQNKKTDFTQEQQNWLLDKDKCPACGYEITIYDKICPDCGIKIRNTAPEKPYSISGDYDNIKYHIKK